MTTRNLPLALIAAAALASMTGTIGAAADPPAKPGGLVAHPAPAQAAPAPAAPVQETPVLIGPTTRDEVEAAPEWTQAEVEARPDADAARELAAVEPGAEVVVFLGTWCGDSRRELPRLWKAIDSGNGAVPFQIRYIGVDHGKKEPAGLVKENSILYLPTFIVRRGGREVGRIVETAPHGIERDLLALLTGKATGVLTTRQDLQPASPPRPQG
jgi:thiol-disulfide isomerase/thioredoxin